MVDPTPQIRHPLLDAIGSGLIVVDRGWRIVEWNAWMGSASEQTAADVHGKSLDEVFPGVAHGRLSTAIAAALDSGVSSLLTHALHPHLFPLKTRSGRTLLHDVTVSAVGDGPGATCLINVFDVTMAVRRERYLRDRQNARYDAVVASAPDVILTLDGDGVIRFANRAAANHFRYSEQELIGMKAAMLFEPEGAWPATWRGVLHDEPLRQPVELVVHRKDGSLSYFEVSASRCQDDSHVFVTAILRDINERRAVNAALRLSEEQSRAAAAALAELNLTLEQRVQERTTQLLKVEEAL